MSEQQRFFCPRCDHELTSADGRSIRLVGRLRGDGFSVLARFDIPSGLGVYGAEWDAYLALEEGCRVEFLCPACTQAFTTSYDPRLAEIKMTQGARTFVVVFNRVYGAHSSFVIDYVERKLVASYGEHADDYVHEFGKNLNFFGT